MLAAVIAVQNGSMSRLQAARHYNIPRATLCDKVSKRTPLFSRLGRCPSHTRNEEQSLVE